MVGGPTPRGPFPQLSLPRDTSPGAGKLGAPLPRGARPPEELEGRRLERTQRHESERVASRSVPQESQSGRRRLECTQRRVVRGLQAGVRHRRVKVDGAVRALSCSGARGRRAPVCRRAPHGGPSLEEGRQRQDGTVEHVEGHRQGRREVRGWTLWSCRVRSVREASAEGTLGGDLSGGGVVDVVEVLDALGSLWESVPAEGDVE